MSVGLKYTPQQVDVLRSTSMRDILAVEGYETAHTRGGLYYSPFRAKETSPSFHIDDVRHQWYDHGDAAGGIAGKAGGDTVSFVMRLKGLSFIDALDYLCRYQPSVIPGIHVDPVRIPDIRDTILSDVRGGLSAQTRFLDAHIPFSSAGLVGYASSRGVPRRVLESACREIRYAIDYESGNGVKSCEHLSIGFANSAGGWVARYPARDPRGGKRSVGPGAPSLISRGGATLPLDGAAATAPSVVVFEGFMDYLSWLTRCRPSTTPSDTDAVVLNSVSNLRRAEPFITAHRNVVSLLDADAAGNAATDRLREACRAAAVHFYDRRDLLRGHKDYNELWQAIMDNHNDKPYL